ncbi:MAG: exodeoxyribonuclease VII small subunit [Chloroflexota bacterium]|nr:exodeoxyribonuclease VII small subunit [Chloroflexota bacterium]
MSDINLNNENITFEQALSKLDEAVKAIEAGGLTLSQSTQLFEEGMKLARICSDMLTSAELKISRIRTAYGDQAYMAEDEMNP